MDIGDDVAAVIRLVTLADHSVEEAAMIVATARGRTAYYADQLVDGYYEEIANLEG